jgi:AcrR family transcriptional regulator
MGVRERKRVETAASIHDAALALFRTKGYGETTVDDIAEATTVSRATVFRYFPAKEDILFAGDAADGVALVEIARSEVGRGTFDVALRAALLGFTAHLIEACDRIWLRWDIVERDVRLLGRAFTAYAGWADELVAVLGDPEVFGHHVVASASVAGLYEAVRRWHRTRSDLAGLVEAALDELGVGVVKPT